MVMKSTIFKTAFIEIKVRKKIFVSLLFMSLLGVGFFAGIKATAPDMKNTLESYFNDLNMMDIEVISPTMLNEDDISSLKEINGITEIEPVISFDAITKYRDKNPVVKVYSNPDNINKLNLVEGRLPENYDECVIDEHILKSNSGFALNEYIEIKDEKNLLKTNKLKIVGVVNSPLYISSLRGNTNLASGSIDYFLYVSKDNFNLKNMYTNLYITTNTKEITYTDSYLDDVNNVIKEIKSKNNNIYVTSRTDNPSYISYIQDTERIENISKVFPIIFFVVAVLISLTSMTRTVEEQRTEIGTLKALGYNKFSISMKYIIYASVATIVGGILGIIIGINLLPRIIYIMYGMMYKTKDLIIGYNPLYSLLGLLLSYICIIGATIFAIEKELKNNPAVLMRPKAPKIGKRVLLEKIPFIWKSLSFTSKVTVRNIFRYKKRFLMTIIGIGGCTSLIFAGYALQDSVSSLLPSQYEKIFLYDIEAISLKEITEEDIDHIKQNDNINGYEQISLQSSLVEKDALSNLEAHIITFNDDSNKFIKLIDYKTKEEMSLKKGVVITQKISELLDVKVGDDIDLVNSNNEKKKAKVIGIAENYLYHYIYMSKEYYEEVYNEKPIFNALLINTKYDDEENQRLVAEDILKDGNFAQAIVTKTTANIMNDTMKNMNYVVLILIVSAGILAFSVLYNLSNVNISERIRELATIKVLGFYDKEVHNYVEKETTLLTAIGIVLGLIMGYFLSLIIIETCELDIMVLPINFSIKCYIYSIIITVIFTLIISVLSYFNLKKIDMIESLKSIE